MWNDANKEILGILDVLDDESVLPLQCPVCGNCEAHLYMYRWNETRNGSVWTWCSNCRACAHERIIMPEWWSNDVILDENLLGVHPDMLEKNKAFVDKFVNLILRGEYPDKAAQQRVYDDL